MMYFAYLGSETETLTDAHLRQDETIMSFSFVEERGDRGARIPNATIEVVNTGLARLVAGPRYCAVMKSQDGTIANAEIVCKGYVSPVPGDLNAKTTKLDIICSGTDSPWDIARAALAIVETYDTPQFDRLFGEVDITNINYTDNVNGERNPVLQRLRDNPNSALEASSSFWRMDPVTHAITQEDIIDSAYPTINIDLNYIDSSLQIQQNQVPVSQVKMTVVADWTQHVTGTVDIAPVLSSLGNSLGYVGGVCYDTWQDYSGFYNNPSTFTSPPVTFINSTGWSTKSVAASIQASTEILFTTTYLIKGNFTSYQAVSGGTQNSTTSVHSLYCYANYSSTRYSVSFNSFLLNYDYTQNRQERAVVVFDGSVQEVSTINFDNILDLGEVSLSDLYQIPNVYPYDPYKVYNQGDQVVAGGRLFQCTKNGTTNLFIDYYIGQQFIERLITNWQLMPSPAAFDKSIYNTYFDSPRGKISIQHAINRCRAAWRKRLLYLSVTVENTWEAFTGIDITKKIRIRVPNDITGASYQSMVGKVSRVEKSWAADKQSIKLTIDVAFGDSTNIAPIATGATVSGDTQFVIAAEDAIYNPVDMTQISSPTYAVVGAAVLNSANTQKQNMNEIQDASGSTTYTLPSASMGFYPTQVRLKMRNLISVPKVARFISIAAMPTVVPRGVDLKTVGGEP